MDVRLVDLHFDGMEDINELVTTLFSLGLLRSLLGCLGASIREIGTGAGLRGAYISHHVAQVALSTGLDINRNHLMFGSKV